MPAAITKTETIRKLLARKSGASITRLQAATAWQPHTVRAAISRIRNTGTAVTRTIDAKGLSVYRILADGDQP